MICKTSLKAQNKDEFYTAMSGGIMAMILIAGAAAVGGAVVLGATDLVETGLTQAAIQIPTASLHTLGSGAGDQTLLTLNIKNAGNELLDLDAGTNTEDFRISISGAGSNVLYTFTDGNGTSIPIPATACEFRTAGGVDCDTSTTDGGPDGLTTPTLGNGLAPGATWAFTGKLESGGTPPTAAVFTKGGEALITVSFGDISHSVTTRVR